MATDNTLLLIEDNPGDAQLIRTYLEEAAFEEFDVVHAESLQDAVLELLDGEPSIVLLDLGLPDSQGLGTLQEFAQHCQNAPIIVLTGNEEVQLGRESIKHGAQDFLNKGDITPGQLIRTIYFALERKAGEARLRDMLSYDPLTELPNRKQFKIVLASRLERMTQVNLKIGLINVDIDGYRQVNEAYGYSAGDRYIKRVALALQQVMAKGDFLARLSSNEFGLITEMPKGTHPDQLAALAEKIQEAISRVRAGVSEQQSTTLTASIGMATAEEPGTSVDVLTQHAEAARHKAKKEGNGLYRYFDEQMGLESKRRQAISKAIQNAEARDEYHLCWQPILDIEAGKLVGTEVLLRWEPKGGTKNIPPSIFFPVLEESQLAASVGNWIIRKTCEQYATWLKQGVIDDSIRIFINLSIRQLEDPKLPQNLEKAMLEWSVPKGALVFELTEDMLLGASAEILEAFNKLHTAGVDFAMDDFGTGLSSLSLVANQPLSYLKIEQGFIKSLLEKGHHEAVTRAIVDLGKHLKIEVIAEGVETSQISEKLGELGCNVQQGYLHGRPMTTEAFEKWISQG